MSEDDIRVSTWTEEDAGSRVDVSMCKVCFNGILSSITFRCPFQVNPCPSRVLGVFGLSVHTTEAQLRQIFSKFGPIDRLKLVYDTKTGRSRGFCFVYYDNKEDARAAKDQCSGMEIDHQRIRVDFSLTARAHSPTPGVYMGKPTREFAERDRDYHHHQSHQPSSNSHRTSSSTTPNHRRPSRRSPSPQYRRKRNRSASYSPRMRKELYFFVFYTCAHPPCGLVS